ncbi:hypothetical protein ASE14_08075 [Agromyces sp. Root81]|uniref:hypothetical protein n=1 Tax=Agromyces sp. Root81 TaxID=1736601 RepID=UPI0006F77471|nr:hypothetical protein [Agromyces sp. Root81]KRC60907.1 hypothetical protein ASE14_08075 [Agromyces sp. Root81]
MSIISPPGAYEGVRPWSSRDAWLRQVETLLGTDAGDQVRRELRVAADRVREVARSDAAVATSTSGRDVATSNRTVGRRLGISYRTVQRARAWLERMRLARTIEAGRYLTTAERAAAGGQLRAASTRALTPVDNHPQAHAARPADQSSVALPRRGDLTPASHLPETKTRRAVSNSGARPVWVQRLAADLDRRMPWLVRYVHIGRLVNGLQQRNLHPATTAGSLLGAIHARGPVRELAEQRDPLAYFLALIDDDLVHGLARAAEATRCSRDGHDWHGQWREVCRRCDTDRPGWRYERDRSAS